MTLWHACLNILRVTAVLIGSLFIYGIVVAAVLAHIENKKRKP